jgi:hypothetical protein
MRHQLQPTLHGVLNFLLIARLTAKFNWTSKIVGVVDSICRT